MAAVATPPPQPCTSMVAPGWTPDFSNSILYAVRYAVGRQAASSKDSAAAFTVTVIHPSGAAGSGRSPSSSPDSGSSASIRAAVTANMPTPYRTPSAGLRPGVQTGQERGLCATDHVLT